MIPFGEHWVEQILDGVQVRVNDGHYGLMRALQNEFGLTRLSALGIMRDCLLQYIEDEIREQEDEFGRVTP